jgi:hypothetical protein
MASERSRIVRNVIAAIVATGTVMGGILTVSQQEGRDVTADTHEAIFAASEVLRSMGLDEAAITAEVRQRVGAANASDGALVADVVRASVGRNRDPRTLRSVALVMPTPVADAAGFDAVWSAIYCEPLADAPTPDLYDACVAQQVGSLGPLLCLADGAPAGHVTRIQATPALAERASALVGEVPGTWVACPDPVTP